MRRSWFAVLVVAALGCAAGRSNVRLGSLTPGPRSLDYDPGIKWWTLPNQLKVALMPDDQTNMVSVEVRYLVGAQDDPSDQRGLAHLVEHLMFERHTAPGGPPVTHEVASHTLYFNAATEHDATHYDSLALDGNLDALLAVEAKRMANGCAGIDQDALDHERSVVLQEYAQRTGNRIFDEVYRVLFGTTGNSRDLIHVTLDDVCRFIDAHYAPDRAILVVAGKLPANLDRRITTWFGAIKRRASAPAPQPAPVAWHGEASDLTLDIDDPTVLVVFPGAAWGTPERLYDDLIDSIVIDRVLQRRSWNKWLIGAGTLHLGSESQGARGYVVSVSDARYLDDAVTAIYTAAHDVPSMQIDVPAAQRS
jgi:predicted Zn-dependent peptidase